MNNLGQEEVKGSSIPEYQIKKQDRRLKNNYDMERGVEDFSRQAKDHNTSKMIYIAFTNEQRDVFKKLIEKYKENQQEGVSFDCNYEDVRTEGKLA